MADLVAPDQGGHGGVELGAVWREDPGLELCELALGLLLAAGVVDRFEVRVAPVLESAVRSVLPVLARDWKQRGGWQLREWAGGHGEEIAIELRDLDVALHFEL